MESKNISAQINVEFTESTTRKNIESGEEIKTLFGKIKKFFSDLKTVAFTGSYNDLTNKPLYAASASAGGTATKALGDKNGSDIAETYFKNKGGTVSGAMTVANQNANVFEIQRTATIYNAVAIKFSLTDGSSIVNVGTAGFTPQKRFQVKHGDYTLQRRNIFCFGNNQHRKSIRLQRFVNMYRRCRNLRNSRRTVRSASCCIFKNGRKYKAFRNNTKLSLYCK